MFGKKRTDAETPRRVRNVVNHEQAMLEYAQKMCDFRRKASAVVIHLSRATGFGYDNYLYAINMFKSLVTRFQGNLFILSNRDLVFAYHGPAGEPAVKTAIFNVRLLFDVPSSEAESESEAAFATWYDLELDYRKFLLYAERVLEEKKVATEKAAKSGQAIADYEEANKPKPTAPSLSDLDKFMSMFNASDLTSLVRRQPICRIGDDGVPVAVFQELYVSIGDLEKKLMPNIRLTSDRYLFQYITNSLDRRVLKLVKAQVEMLPASNFSLNLNVATFLSEEFAALDAVLPEEARKGIVLEFSRVDVLADIGMYIVVRDRARERGYKVCMDGLSALIMPYIRLQDLGFDMLKVNWTADLASAEGDEMRGLLEGVIQRCKESQVILCHCDNAEAIAFGHRLGIKTFQGRHVDALLAERQN